jgi:formylglycine-generating enzyme
LRLALSRSLAVRALAVAAAGVALALGLFAVHLVRSPSELRSGILEGTQPGIVQIPGARTTRGSGRVPDEPRKPVELTAFGIDRTEVSIAQFEVFAAEGYTDPQWWTEEGWLWSLRDPGGAGAELRRADRSEAHPVVAVTWYEADAYCRWRGGALPTEAQWEYAACGEDTEGRYPWGDSEDVATVWFTQGKHGHVRSVGTEEADSPGSSNGAPWGLSHASGNVWEWTSSWYHRDAYLDDADVDPTGPADGTWKTLRGGSFMNLPSYCTCTHREPARPDRASFTTGFRCAYPPE